MDFFGIQDVAQFVAGETVVTGAIRIQFRLYLSMVNVFHLISKWYNHFTDRKKVKMKKTFTAFVEYDDESKLYVGIIPNVLGAHTQAENLDELQRNLQEVLVLCLEENPEIANETLHFVGTQQVEVAL